jgi:hypothetical protein
MVSQRSVRCLRLPDGTIADTTPYYQLTDAIRKDAHRASRGVDRRAGPFIEHVVTESWWELDPRGPAALGWGLHLPREKNPAVRRSGRSGPDALEWAAGDLYRPRVSVCYIDAENPDPITWSRSPGGVAEVGSVFVGGIVEVTLHHPDEPMDRAVFVKIPDPAVASRGYLSGRFILWPDPTITAPRRGTASSDAPDAAGYWEECGPKRYALSAGAIADLRTTAGAMRLVGPDRVYRYIPASAMAVTPSELAEAMLDDDLKLYDWTLRIQDGKGVWTQKRVTISPATPAAAETPSAP